MISLQDSPDNQGSNGETDIENRLIDTGERGGEGELYGESNMETYITICKIANGNLLWGSRNSKRGSVST